MSDSSYSPPPDYCRPPADYYTPPQPPLYQNLLPRYYTPPPPVDYYSPPPPYGCTTYIPDSFSDGGSSDSGSSKTTGVVVGVVVLLLVVAAIAGVIIYCVCFRKKKPTGQQVYHKEQPQGKPAVAGRSNMVIDVPESGRGGGGGEVVLEGPRDFSYSQLSQATENFSEKHKVGGGGFGAVYRGTLVVRAGSGQQTLDVAIKAMAPDTRQGFKAFLAEIKINRSINHRHLLKLEGWCQEGEKLLLVYDFMPNGSLDYWLHGDAQYAEMLNWSLRHDIAKGVALAVHYLHEELDRPILHRDIKSSNVMLDEQFKAKLGDFGLSREADHADGAAFTTKVAGSLGYMPPELYSGGKASKASDVFSFGALLLELAAGKRPLNSSLRHHEGRLVDWVWDLRSQDRLLDAADPRLNAAFDPDSMTRVLLVGLACSHPNPQRRYTILEAMAALQASSPIPSDVSISKPVMHFTDGPSPDNTQSSTASTTATTTTSFSSNSYTPSTIPFSSTYR